MSIDFWIYVGFIVIFMTLVIIGAICQVSLEDDQMRKEFGSEKFSKMKKDLFDEIGSKTYVVLQNPNLEELMNRVCLARLLKFQAIGNVMKGSDGIYYQAIQLNVGKFG